MSGSLKALASLLLILTFGFLFPVAFPGRRLTLVSLLSMLLGFFLACWLGLVAFKSGGLILALAVIAVVNALIAVSWFAFVLLVTRWLGPHKSEDCPPNKRDGTYDAPKQCPTVR